MRVLRLQKQELCRDQGGHLVLDWARDEDNALLQEARINVIGPLAAVGLLDHHGHQRVQVYMAQVFHCCPEGLDGAGNLHLGVQVLSFGQPACQREASFGVCLCELNRSLLNDFEPKAHHG